MTIDSSCGLRHAAWRVVQTFPKTQLNLLQDICDLVAHPRKNRFELVELINKNIDALAFAFSSEAAGAPSMEVFSAELIATLLLTVSVVCVTHVLQKVPEPESLKGKLGEIALCVMSALQDSIILFTKEKNNKSCFDGAGRLFLSEWEGRLKLYCIVTGERADHISGRDTQGRGRFFFPVITSQCQSQEGLDLRFQNDALPGLYTVKRATNGKLIISTFAPAVRTSELQVGTEVENPPRSDR